MTSAGTLRTSPPISTPSITATSRTGATSGNFSQLASNIKWIDRAASLSNAIPSLSDPAWLSKIHDRLVETARFYAPYRPLFYSLGDESGIANLAAFWDFDFSDESLVPMRRWLRELYGTLQALNEQWATTFTS